jgi:hypothetical protein
MIQVNYSTLQRAKKKQQKKDKGAVVIEVSEDKVEVDNKESKKAEKPFISFLGYPLIWIHSMHLFDVTHDI